MSTPVLLRPPSVCPRCGQNDKVEECVSSTLRWWCYRCNVSWAPFSWEVKL